MARKQGLMTDDEFQSILDGVTGRKEDTTEMAEGLDLASKSIWDNNTSEPERESEDIAPQSIAGVADEQLVEKEPEVPTEEPESVAPPVIKSNIVKRKLVLKDDTKAERQKPKRISQRCLGRGMARKAGASTASDAVVISSEDERTTPTKPEEQSLSAANQEDTSTTTEVIPTTPTDREVGTPTEQREETAKMAEGLDLASTAVEDSTPTKMAEGLDQAYRLVETFGVDREETSGRRRG